MRTNSFNPNKTKHFLFYTGGLDSTLILCDLVRLMKRNTEDELVILTLANETLGSGREEKVKRTVSYLDVFLQNVKRDNPTVHRRITYSIFRFSMQSVNVSPNISSDSLLDGDLFFKKKDYAKNLSMQENLIISHAPQILYLCGNCKNRVYIGQNGSDINSMNFFNLKELFDKQIDSMLNLVDDRDSLHYQISKLNQDTGTTKVDDNYYDTIEKVRPILEFPLYKSNRSVVIGRLKEYRCADFECTKEEDHILFYGNVLFPKIVLYAAIVDDLRYNSGVGGFAPMPLEEYINDIDKFYYNTVSGDKVYLPEEKIKKIQMDKVKEIGKKAKGTRVVSKKGKEKVDEMMKQIASQFGDLLPEQIEGVKDLANNIILGNVDINDAKAELERLGIAV